MKYSARRFPYDKNCLFNINELIIEATKTRKKEERPEWRE